MCSHAMFQCRQRWTIPQCSVSVITVPLIEWTWVSDHIQIKPSRQWQSNLFLHCYASLPQHQTVIIHYHMHNIYESAVINQCCSHTCTLRESGPRWYICIMSSIYNNQYIIFFSLWHTLQPQNSNAYRQGLVQQLQRGSTHTHTHTICIYIYL